MLPIGDVRNFERLTGSFLFQPNGSVGLFPIGNSTMSKLDAKIERKDIYRMMGGKKVLARTDVTAINPEYQIDGDEINSIIETVLNWGKRGADLVQAASGSLTLSITAALGGMTYILGGMVDVSVTSVTPAGGGGAWVAGTDYTVDVKKGLLYVLPGGAVASVGTNLTVAYSAAAVTREVYLPFSQMQQKGVLKGYDVDSDETENLPLREITFPVTLWCESAGDRGNPDNERKFSLRCRITGPTSGRVYRRVDPQVAPA